MWTPQARESNYLVAIMTKNCSCHFYSCLLTIKIPCLLSYWNGTFGVLRVPKIFQLPRNKYVSTWNNLLILKWSYNLDDNAVLSFPAVTSPWTLKYHLLIYLIHFGYISLEFLGYADHSLSYYHYIERITRGISGSFPLNEISKVSLNDDCVHRYSVASIIKSNGD